MEWVEVNVTGEVKKLLFRFDENGFVSVLEEPADALAMTMVEVLDVAGAQ